MTEAPKASPKASPEPAGQGNLSGTAAALGQMLADAQVCAEALLATLTDEQAALTGTDPAALKQAITAKADRVAQLEALEQTRQHLVGGDLDTWLTTQPAEVTALLAAPRAALRKTLAACREQNSLNGRVLARASQSTAELLSLLSGQVHGTTYSATGTSTPQRSGGTLAEA